MISHSALSQAELDHMGCDDPHCTTPHEKPLFIHPACHMNGGLDAAYEDGILFVHCHVCDKHVATFKISEE